MDLECTVLFWDNTCDCIVPQYNHMLIVLWEFKVGEACFLAEHSLLILLIRSALRWWGSGGEAPVIWLSDPITIPEESCFCTFLRGDAIVFFYIVIKTKTKKILDHWQLKSKRMVCVWHRLGKWLPPPAVSAVGIHYLLQALHSSMRPLSVALAALILYSFINIHFVWIKHSRRSETRQRTERPPASSR